MTTAQDGGKVVSLTHQNLAPGNFPGTHFCWRLSQPQGHSAARRVMSMKNSNDTTGNWIRYLPVCSAVPQPTAPPRTLTDCFTPQEISLGLVSVRDWVEFRAIVRRERLCQWNIPITLSVIEPATFRLVAPWTMVYSVLTHYFLRIL